MIQPIRTTSMVSPLMLLSDMAREAATTYWAEDHAELVKKLPSLMEYNQRLFSNTDRGFWPTTPSVGTTVAETWRADGCSEIRFRSMAAMLTTGLHAREVYLDDSGVRFSILHPGYIPTGMTEGTERPSRLLPTATPDDCARAVVDAVQHNRFDVWSPANQWIGIKLGHLVGRAVRERVLLAMGIGKIADHVDQSARANYYERAFGGKH